MSSSTTNKEVALNTNMIKFVPELASDYAKYPLRRDRWLDPSEQDPKGRPCFEKASSGSPLKLDFVLGRGICGEGYYSMLTQDAYKNLYSRVSNESPTGCCACSKAARAEYDAYDDVRRLMYNRSVATKPDDQVAAQDAMNAARSTAQAWHNGLQNEQLAINAVQLATL